MTTSVLIVENSQIISAGIRQMLASHKDICVVGAVRSLNEATEVVVELHPDVTLLDLGLADSAVGSLDEAHTLVKLSRTVVCMSLRRPEDTVELTAALGTTQCVDKMNLSRDLPGAIREARTLPS